MTIKISNADDIIDSRDVIARIEELETELEDVRDGQGGEDVIDFDNWLTETANDDSHTFQDAAAELIALKALAAEAEGYAADWSYGEALIRDSYFQTYAEELADDIGAINREQAWPLNCIDWAQAARELQQDYTAVDFDGVTYWVR